jgi:hypothetical protein
LEFKHGEFFCKYLGWPWEIPMAVVIAKMYIAMLEVLLKNKLTLINIEWPHF